MRAMKLGLTLSLPLSVAVLGCSADMQPSDDPASADQSLSASFGGMTTTSEAPSFADPAFDDGDLTLADPAAVDPTTPDPSLANAAAVRLFVAWGYLRPHPNATETVDWSGSISVDNGAIVVAREVHFEPHDMVIRPRTDPKVVDFESHTRPAMDGLVLEILFPANGTTTVTFSSAPIMNSITITPGERLSEIVPVDAAGHVLAYHIIHRDGGTCHEGFVRGHWTVINPATNAPTPTTASALGGREIGVFRGRFMDGKGQLEGTMRGVFGVRKDGHNLFFGKVIDLNGNFRALVAGTYGNGAFHGRILLNDGHVVDGVVHGKYRDDNDGDTTPDGGFVGRWSQKCGEDPMEGQPMTSDEMAPPTAAGQ